MVSFHAPVLLAAVSDPIGHLHQEETQDENESKGTPRQRSETSVSWIDGLLERCQGYYS
jgi:hypothetical protein